MKRPGHVPTTSSAQGSTVASMRACTSTVTGAFRFGRHHPLRLRATDTGLMGQAGQAHRPVPPKGQRVIVLHPRHAECSPGPGRDRWRRTAPPRGSPSTRSALAPLGRSSGVAGRRRSLTTRPTPSRRSSSSLVTIVGQEPPPRRFIAGADAIGLAELRVAELKAQIDAYRRLSTSLDSTASRPSGRCRSRCGQPSCTAPGTFASRTSPTPARSSRPTRSSPSAAPRSAAATSGRTGRGRGRGGLSG
jgi:hypothetical protein